jgi:hypothetical protein
LEQVLFEYEKELILVIFIQGQINHHNAESRKATYNSASTSTNSSPNKNANAFSGNTKQTLDHTNTKMCTKLYRSLCEMYSQGERGSGDIQCPAVCGTQIAPR